MPERRRTTIRLDEGGNVQPDSSAFVKWLADQFSLFADGRAVVTVERPKRTLAQNRYYFGYIIRPIRQALMEAGHPISAEALHEHFKALYLPAKGSYTYTDTKTGEVKEVVEKGSTTDLDQSEFDRYCERIRNSELVRQLGVYLPRPGDPDEAFMEVQDYG